MTFSACEQSIGLQAQSHVSNPGTVQLLKHLDKAKSPYWTYWRCWSCCVFEPFALGQSNFVDTNSRQSRQRWEGGRVSPKCSIRRMRIISLTWGWRGRWYCQKKTSQWNSCMFSGETSILRVKVFLRPMHWKWYAASSEFDVFLFFLRYVMLDSFQWPVGIRWEEWLPFKIDESQLLWRTSESYGVYRFILVFKLYRWNWTDWRSCCCCFESVYSMGFATLSI